MKNSPAMQMLSSLVLGTLFLSCAAANVQRSRFRAQTLDREHVLVDKISRDNQTAVKSVSYEALHDFLPPRVTAKYDPSDANWQWLPIGALMTGSAWMLWNKASENAFDRRYLLEFMFVVTLYYTSAPAIIFVNNDLLNKQSFKFPITVASMGVLGTTIVAHVMIWTGMWTLKTQSISTESWMKSVLAVAACGAAALVLGNYAYLVMPVSLLQVLKSTTLVLTLVFGWLAGVEKLTWRVSCAVLIIALGSAAAPLDFANIFSAESSAKGLVVGLFLSTSANIAEASRVILTQVSVLKMSFQDSLYWCSRAMLGTQVLLVLICEARGLAQAHWNAHVVWRLLGSMLAGAVVTISSWWLTKLVGGLSLKVLTNARNYAVIALAIYVYSEPFTKIECICYTACLAGVFFYESSKAAAREMKQ